MNGHSAKKIVGLIIGIVISVLIIISGVLIGLSCYSIYSGTEVGEQAFTYEKIGEAFSRIAIPVYITLGAVLLGGIWAIFDKLTGAKKERLVPKKGPRQAYKRYVSRLKLELLPQDEQDKLAKFATKRKELDLIAGICMAVAWAVHVVFLLHPRLYLGTTSTEVTREVLYCTYYFGGFLIFAVVIGFIHKYFSDKLYSEELELLEQIAKSNDISFSSNKEPNLLVAEREKRRDSIYIWLRGGLILLAAGFIIIGIFNGGMQDVWKKAAEICAECIGLG